MDQARLFSNEYQRWFWVNIMSERRSRLAMMRRYWSYERPENLNNLDKGLLKCPDAQVLIATSSEAALAVNSPTAKPVDLIVVDEQISGLYLGNGLWKR